MIPQEFIRDLNARADLIELIGGQVRLKRAGKNWLGLCPFHAEKTPSFSVNNEQGFYHCFGCGAHGTAIGFVQRQQGLDFVAAVKKLAALYGMTVPQQSAYTAANADKRARIHALLADAMRFFQAQLRQSDEAKNYLKSRGLTGETAKRYKIGYAPPQWEALLEALKKNATPKQLADAGLAREKEGGKFYDYFRHRIIFPIIDSSEHVLGFGGRALSEDNQPKYLNSSEGAQFSKRRVLYGLPQALKAAREKKRLIICEGYMDVVMLAQGGFAESAATMGTAATAEQMRKGAQLVPNIYLAYDGDSAGQKGAERALQGILPALKDGSSVFFLFMPAGHDPDSYLRENGAAAFEELLRQALPLGQFFIKTLKRQTETLSAEGQATGAMRKGKELLQLMDGAQAGGWRDLLQKKLQEETGISFDAVPQKRAIRQEHPAARAKGAYRLAPQNVLYQLLCCLSVKPDLIEPLLHTLPLPAPQQEAEIIKKLLHKLRWYIPAADEQSIDVPGFIEREGYTKLAAQMRQSIKERYTTVADIDAEIAVIVQQLENKHKRLTRPGRAEWLRQLTSPPSEQGEQDKQGEQ